MNWELLYTLEFQENKKLREKIIDISASKDILYVAVKVLRKQKEELLQEIEKLKAQLVTQNVAPKEKLVERIIIETYEKYI